MKAMKLIALTVMTVMGIEASAQLTKELDEWTRFEISFDAQKIKYEGNSYESEGEDPKGAAIAIMHGVSLTNSIPLFLDLGGRISWTHYSESFTGGKSKFTNANIAIPVEAAYKFSFANSPKIKIVPFFGPNFKFNFIARRKWCPDEGDNVKTNLFKEENGDAKIFQVGLNLGVGVHLGKFYVGYNFQPDISSFQKNGSDKVKTKNNYISIGFDF